MTMNKFRYIMVSSIAGIVSMVCAILAMQETSLQAVFGGVSLLGLLALVFGLFKAITFERTHIQELPQGSNVYANVCPHCGTMLKGHERYCPSCNEDVSEG